MTLKNPDAFENQRTNIASLKEDITNIHDNYLRDYGSLASYILAPNNGIQEIYDFTGNKLLINGFILSFTEKSGSDNLIKLFFDPDTGVNTNFLWFDLLANETYRTNIFFPRPWETTAVGDIDIQSVGNCNIGIIVLGSGS